MTDHSPLPQQPRERTAGWLFQVLAEKRLGVVPQLVRRAFAIAWPVIGEKGMAGAVVDLGGDVLAGAAEAGAISVRTWRL